MDDLQPAADPVSGGARSPQRAGAALERRRGHGIQNQRPTTEMPRSKATFGAVLAGQHPVHRRIQVILVTRSHPEQLPGELVTVSVRSPRAVASFEPRAITWANSIAATGSRGREGVGPIGSATPTCINV